MNIVKSKFIYAGIIALLNCSFVFSQPVAVLPIGSNNQGALSTGNSLQPRCSGKNPSTLRVSVYPSCYGVNLRHDTGPVSGTGNITMKMTIQKPGGGGNFVANVTFPPKAVWQENVGKVCSNVNRTARSLRCPVINPATNKTVMVTYQNCVKKSTGVSGVKGEYWGRMYKSSTS